jgi:uncharacterized membrane protein YozB (DUF420 family)
MVTLAQMNLLLQIGIFVVLSISMYTLKRGRHIARHGVLMVSAVVLNFISFLLVMGPSILGLQPFIVARPSHVLSIAMVVHASTGTIAEIIGGYLVAVWRFSASVKTCVRRKTGMRVTLGVWLIALVSGFLAYALLYT